METLLSNNVNDFIENLVISYEARLNQIESIFTTSETITESSNNLMTDFQKSVHKLKNERELLNNQLRDVLAKKGSLRRKDYDKMMESILSFLEKKEIEAEKLFCEYIVRQKSMASTLKTGLLNINDPHAENAPEKIKQFKQELQQITKSQEERKECIKNQFLIFQQINNNVINKLKELLGKRDKICAKDVKVVVRDLINNSIV